MSYAVKEVFLTLQGEGAHAGRRAVFCRFAGCNLWSGQEADRAEAECNFCDTDFVGTDGTRGARYPDAESLAAVGRQSNLITELVEHDTGRLQDCFFCFDHQNLHQATSYAANEMPFGIRKKQG